MKIGNREFDTDKHTYVMGILNVTPDSFYDGSNYNDIDRALKRAHDMQREGAHIIDIGGESTRPGYTRISPQEEIERVAPVIEAIKKEVDLPISLDTYKPDVAQAGIAAGADLINDIWGLKWDPAMADIISKENVSCCLMHNRKSADYDSFADDVISDLKESVNIALKAGIDQDKIILDPGVGFAKDTEQNLEVIAVMDRIRDIGYPTLLGVSRKSVVGNVLDVPKQDRLAGTLALDMIGFFLKTSFVRVHDVKEHVQALRMAEEVFKYRR